MSYQEYHAKMGLSITLALILLPIWISAASAEFLKFAEDQDTGTVFGVSNYSHLMQHEPCLFNMSSKTLLGIAPRSVDLLNDSQVKRLVRIAIEAYWKRCPQVAYQTERQKQSFGGYGSNFQLAVNLSWESSRYPEVVMHYELTAERKLKLAGYSNYARDRAERAAAEDARQKAEQEERERIEAQRRAEEARLAREQAEKEAARQRRWNEFARKHSVQEVVKESDLFTNPFLYQGKTVAVTLRFQRMITANSATFVGGNGVFVVSNIPTGTYRSQRQVPDVLAVKVTGMTEIKGLPLVNSMQVPNLRFVGVHLCNNWGCTDLLK